MTDSSLDRNGGTEPILAPEEIEALMQSVAPGEQAHAMLAMLPPLLQPENVEEYRFPSALDNGPERYPLLYTLQQRMAESIKDNWSEVFKREITISSEGIVDQTYEEIIKPSDEKKKVYFVFEALGFGRMMIACEIGLIIAYIDAMLGGSGETFEVGGDALSPVEYKLSVRIADQFKELLSNMWEPVTEMEFKLLKLEVDPQFLAVAGLNDSCFSIAFETKLSEDLRGDFFIHYPRTFLEPILDNLRTASSEEPKVVDAEWESKLHQSIEKVPLTIRLEMGRCELNIKQFLALRPGDFLPISKNENEPSLVWVSSYPMFEAMPGSRDGMLAAELTKQIAKH